MNSNIFLVAIAIMAAYTLLKLTSGFRSLIADSDRAPNGAVDLRFRHDEVQRWLGLHKDAKELVMRFPTIRTNLRRIRSMLKRNPDSFLRGVSGVIHVGANTGQERELYEKFGLHVVWIEPIPEV